MSPRDLAYFLEVARQGQLAQAAGTLGVTAAALSKAIRRLEEEMGLRLFERTGQGMALTPFGASFQERAQRLKSGHDDALRHAGDVRAGRAGLLRIGATLAVLDTVISPALSVLQPRRPGMHVRLAVASSDELLERARHGTLDAAIVPTYDALPHGLSHVELGADELVAVVRANHPLLARRKLALGDLTGTGWVMPGSSSAARSRLEAVFRGAGVAPPREVVEVDFNSSWSLPLVASTELVALVPRSTLSTEAARGVAILPVAALTLARTISLFSRPDAYWSPLMSEFVQALKNLRPARQRKAPKT
jgi:DNA-binding transcriptional LysR family regulator